MRQVHGGWLREQRLARGWAVPEMRRRLREAARQAGDNLPDNECLSVMIHRWEGNRSGISERYRLHYCHALGIPLAAFGKSPPEFRPVEPRQPPAADTPLMLAEAAVSVLTALVAALRDNGTQWAFTEEINGQRALDLAERAREALRELTGRPGH